MYNGLLAIETEPSHTENKRKPTPKSRINTTDELKGLPLIVVGEVRYDDQMLPCRLGIELAKESPPVEQRGDHTQLPSWVCFDMFEK